MSILLAIFLIATNTLDFNPIRFHCENYILNSYLYLFLSIAIIFSTVFSMNNLNVNINNLFAGSSRFLLFILSIILMVSLIMLTPKYFFTKHILWILWIILMGIFIYPLYKYKRNLFYHCGIATLTIVTVLSLLAFSKPDLIKDSWGFNLFIILLGLVVARVVEQLLGNWKIIDQNKYNKMFSYISIVLFSFFILYDTKMIIKNAGLCGTSLDPDYINQSIDILLDSLNIFTNLANIKD